MLLLLFSSNIMAQTSGQWGICEFETTTALNNFDPGDDAWSCKIAFVSDNDTHYRWDGDSWETISVTTIYNGNGSITNDRQLTLGAYDLELISGGSQSALTLQRTDNTILTGIAFRNSGDSYAASISLSTSDSGNSNGLDFHTIGNQGTISNLGLSMRLTNTGQLVLPEYGSQSFSDTAVYQLAVNTDGEVIETNTATSSKIFYPPAIALDASSTATSLTLDLHQEYVTRFSSPAVASTNAPAAIPTYQEDELYYYVTDFDAAVLDNVSIDEDGVMTYDIIAVPTGNCTVLNVVFVVK